MKNILHHTRHALAAALLAGTAVTAGAQDSVWIKFDNRFLDNKPLAALDGCDSIEFRANGTIPVLRRYSTQYSKGYFDVRLNSIMGNTPGMLTFGNPGLVVYRPLEFASMDFMDNESKWSFERSRESEHFIVFWAKEFGSDPGASSVPAALRVDIDDLLKKAEQFYSTNVDKLKMVVTGEGKSQLDRYKMEIYLLYQTEWLATGSGYDNKVGALWVNPSTCQPVGSTIGHEIGHSFQYQTYCDNILQGKSNDMKSGFRYGYPGSNGGCGFWEQCAQWQSYQDYPSEAINNYHFSVWMANHHRHFENEWQRYASYWLQYYMTEKNGITALGRIWNESVYPEDAIQAYTRIFCGGDYDMVKQQLFEYAQKCATFDFDQIRKYVTTHYDSYSTKFLSAGNGWWQVTYDNCPAPTGFNVVPLDVPAAGTVVKASIQGLVSGTELLPGDPGQMVDGDGAAAGTTSAYNNTAVAGKEGWAYGFVALKTGNVRVYGDANFVAGTSASEAEFTVPEGTKRLFLIVQGAPTSYRQSPWDEKESTDDQLPYRLKVNGTTIKGYVGNDEPDEPVEVTAENAKYRVARISIATENAAPITGKDKADYVNCTVTVDSDYDEWDYEGTGRIRGRGNSTWLWYDKKPYRIKLDKKASVLGLDTEKDWVLLANYRDPTDMMNTFAFCAGEGMGLPFTNHSRFAEVTLNGDYIGVYQLTEQVEVGAGRVDIDETSGILLGIDADDGPDLSPDAGDNFWSAGYGLPICVKSPEDQTAVQLQAIKDEFAKLEQAIKSHDMAEVRTYLDVDDFMKYMIVQMLVYNVEMAAPRSVYMYRAADETQWHAGPLWDFDAGYDFDWADMMTGHDYFADYRETILGSDPANHVSTYPDVSSFFTDLWKSKEFVAAFQQYWASVKDKIVSEYWAETQKYADAAKAAMQRDAERWPIGKDFSTETGRMKTWLTDRVEWMDQLVRNYPTGE